VTKEITDSLPMATECPAGCWSCQNPVQKAFRTRFAPVLYRRISLPFRLAFKWIAFLRSKPPQRLGQDPSDTYLGAHTQDYFKDRWLYGYHRVFDLTRNFHPITNPASLKVLSLGPRTEIELYYLWLFCSFAWKNIVGVDLVSTSPKIKLGDMSIRLPFDNDSFDVIVASHCLEKSRDPHRTRDEIQRVTKPGARVLVCGNRAPEGTRSAFPYRGHEVPVHFFRSGAYGLIELYQLHLEEIEYMNARSPHGFEIIFRVNK